MVAAGTWRLLAAAALRQLPNANGNAPTQGQHEQIAHPSGQPTSEALG